MESQHTSILKRVGAGLLMVGLIDIALLINSISNGITYKSSFHLFAVIPGVFLLRGSLRTASVVRWYAVLMLPASTAWLLAWPFMQPFELTRMQIRLGAGPLFAEFGFKVFLLGLFVWLVWELGREPVKAARVRAGRKQRDMWIPAVAGVGLAIVIGIFISHLLGSESGQRAKSIAQQQVGTGYRFHVSSLSIAKTHQGTFVSGVVIAWNDNEIRKIPVRWREQGNGQAINTTEGSAPSQPTHALRLPDRG